MTPRLVMPTALSIVEDGTDDGDTEAPALDPKETLLELKHRHVRLRSLFARPVRVDRWEPPIRSLLTTEDSLEAERTSK